MENALVIHVKICYHNAITNDTIKYKGGRAVMKKIRRILCLALCLALCFSNAAFAHSGRTDGNGGHRDNNNVSGLGYYHYHCGGNPAHLHPNGVCPYQGGGSADPAPAVPSTPDPSPTPTPKPKPEIKIKRKTTKMAVGTTFLFKTSKAGGSNVKWITSNSKVAKVYRNGKVVARRAGWVTITAKANGSNDKCRIKIVDPRMTPTRLNLKVGESKRIIVKGSNSKKKWNTSKRKIATVTDKGVVTGNSAGSSKITVRVDGKLLKCTVTVTK